MIFKANVTLLDSEQTRKQKANYDEAKSLLLQALALLVKDDASVLEDAESFLKGV